MPLNDAGLYTSASHGAGSCPRACVSVAFFSCIVRLNGATPDRSSVQTVVGWGGAGFGGVGGVEGRAAGVTAGGATATGPGFGAGFGSGLASAFFLPPENARASTTTSSTPPAAPPPM